MILFIVLKNDTLEHFFKLKYRLLSVHHLENLFRSSAKSLNLEYLKQMLILDKNIRNSHGDRYFP